MAGNDLGKVVERREHKDAGEAVGEAGQVRPGPVGITVVTGIVWGLDAWLLRPRRSAAARAAGRDPAQVPEPGTVDYARSFFPVALVVLVLRCFVFEPFRIPSDSMMPTLLDGDFIVVNKFAYGLRLPVINRKIVDIGEPQRGDVVVFRWPPDPSTNFIKRHHDLCLRPARVAITPVSEQAGAGEKMDD
jgi:hypothetical protein